jgi:UDP-2,3-diacylglucosamine pyrophosphatase LpxH
MLARRFWRMTAFPWARRPVPTREVRLPPDRPFFVVSDLHMGDGSRSDAFVGKDDLFLSFLDHVRSEGVHLVICGDIIDFPQAFTFTRVLRAHSRLFRGLAEVAGRSGITYVWGNHDYDIALYQDLLRWEVCSHVKVGEDVVIEHGHQLDPYVGAYPRESAMATSVHHLLERLLGTWLRYPLCSFYTRSNRLVWWAGYRGFQVVSGIRSFLARHHLPLVGDRFLDTLEYWIRCELGDSMCIFAPARREIREEGLRILLTGHSHKPGRIEVEPGRWYVNDGSWTFRSTQYARWNGSNFDVLDWPENRVYGEAGYRRILDGSIDAVGIKDWWNDMYAGWLRFRCNGSSSLYRSLLMEERGIPGAEHDGGPAKGRG